ncbi:MAG: hypothetical protein HDT37_00855 [Clostridiales bacterium]|nr:hypothetical protein [Clostridiales bacterium]
MGENSILERLWNSSGPIVLFGASVAGRKIRGLLKKHNPAPQHIVFCDNYKHGVEPITNTAIISPNELCNYKDAIICICIMSPALHEEVRTQLVNFGFSSNQIIEYPVLAEAFKENYELLWSDMEDSYDWTQNQPWIAEMSKWIDDDDHSVIDYGAGACYLKQCLRSDVTYISTDYIARSDETVVFDYNKDPFPNICADVGFMAFSLQSAIDWESLLAHVCRASNRKVIIGNAIMFPGSETLILVGGQTNFYSDAPIIQTMEKNGFVLQEKKIAKWGDGSISELAMLLFAKC